MQYYPYTTNNDSKMGIKLNLGKSSSGSLLSSNIRHGLHKVLIASTIFLCTVLLAKESTCQALSIQRNGLELVTAERLSQWTFLQSPSVKKSLFLRNVSSHMKKKVMEFLQNYYAFTGKALLVCLREAHSLQLFYSPSITRN